MRYVILRDDDTNALTPVDCLERLYRPFLDRGLPVNLAVVPDVSTKVTLPDGQPEGFLMFSPQLSASATQPIGGNKDLVRYLLKNPGFHVAQHGLHHDRFEFDLHDRGEIRRRLARGTELLVAAGLPEPKAFVAPHDRFTRTSLDEVAKRFPTVSSGWYEKARLPASWWPRYLLKKISGAQHWRIRQTLLLSHPGCLLSRQRPRETILEQVKQAVRRAPLTVLVTHWWEYFPDQKPDVDFIWQLHAVGHYLANDPEIKVISFAALRDGVLSAYVCT
ncbi:MAG: hypothetical protein JWQ04_2709 [Pedosphaera sp.]|nr:hypothetical protein [Pedosphaera sp.]